MNGQKGFPRPVRQAAPNQDPVIQALRLEASGMIGEAERALRQIVAARPKDVNAWRELGRILRITRDVRGSEDALRRALKLDPRDLGATLMLGMLLQHQGRTDDALKEFEKAIWIAPKDERGYCTKAAILEMGRDPAKALAVVEAAQAKASPAMLAEVYRARFLRRLGRLDEARAIVAPIAADAARPPEIRWRAGYELARILDRMGDHAGAFAAATEANRLHAASPEAKAVYSTQWFGHIEALRRIEPERLAGWAGHQYHDGLTPPIFLVGFPRSGTTMIEQMLASHPAVAVSNEREMVHLALGELFRGQSDTPNLGALVDSLPEERFLAARSVYHRISESIRAEKPGATRVLDKYPMNLFQVSLLARVFPEARVIVAMRDPRDVCLSCFMQEFIANRPMVHFHTLDDTARMYELVMGTWLAQRQSIPIPTLEVRYESITRNAEPEARRILEFCGLNWDPAVLRFHEKEHQRWVSTPSYEAISRPLHTEAQGRWKRHRAELAPILPRLEPFVEALGYDRTDAG